MFLRLFSLALALAVAASLAGCGVGRPPESASTAIEPVNTGQDESAAQPGPTAPDETPQPVEIGVSNGRPDTDQPTVTIEPVMVEPNQHQQNGPEPDLPEPVPTGPDNLDTRQAEPNRPEPVAAEPNLPEPDRSEPPVAEPNKADIPTQPVEQVEPNLPEQVSAEPDQPEQVAAEPNVPEPGSQISAPAEPNDTPAVTPEPNLPEPNQAGPTPAEPDSPATEVGEPDKPAVDANEPEDVNTPHTEPNDVKTDSATAFHNGCAEILKTHVRPDGLIDYRTLRRRRVELNRLLDRFDKLDRKVYESWSRNDKIAFWINAYNLQMLKIITENYPIRPSSRILTIYYGPKSIRHIDGIWTKNKFLVMDEVFKLADIEKRFFRKEFGDPRVFLALTRASLSGPPLRPEPYYGRTLDRQLDEQVRVFLADSGAFRVDTESQKVYLSALFQVSSYGSDFIPKYGIDRKFKEQVPATRAVLNFISKYVSEDIVSFLEVGNYSVQFIKYDWTINDGS